MADEVKKRYNYQYDSTARAYEQPMVKPVPITEPLRRPRKATKKKLDVTFGMQLSICGVVLFTSAFLYINSYASLRAKQDQLIDLKNNMIALKSSISETQAKISETLNLDYIRERAASELGMREPLPHQIVYIELPEESYTSYDSKK